MLLRQRILGFSVFLFFVPFQVQAETYEECLAREVVTADGKMKLQALRTLCSRKTNAQESPLSERIQEEKENKNNRFTITPHKPNYILPFSYNKTPNTTVYKNAALKDNFSYTEVKFQLSVKAPLINNVFNNHSSLWVAYTNTSWWQAYNNDSAPFRETNHEPEVFLAFHTNYDVMGMNMDGFTLGFSHQSNGRSGSLSRSWNRVYANFVFSKDNVVLSLKPWWRIPESEKTLGPDGKPVSSQGDDNPDIYDYMGYGEFGIAYTFNEHVVSMMLRNNLRKDNKGAIRLDWSFPINQRFKGYVQYFNGYGESLIDYNNHISRYSLGVMLTDWL